MENTNTSLGRELLTPIPIPKAYMEMATETST